MLLRQRKMSVARNQKVIICRMWSFQWAMNENYRRKFLKIQMESNHKTRKILHERGVTVIFTRQN